MSTFKTFKNLYQSRRTADPTLTDTLDRIHDTLEGLSSGLITVSSSLGKTGATGPVGPTGPSGVGTYAPNITSATGSITDYFPWNNATLPVFAGMVTLPTADPDYSHLKVVVVFAAGPTTADGMFEIERFEGPFTGGTLSYAGSNPNIRQSNVAQPGWNLEFICYNENYVPTAAPYTITGLTILASELTGLSNIMDHVSLRWKDSSQALHGLISFKPVGVSNFPINFTAWIDRGYGDGPQWHGWDLYSSYGQALYIGAQSDDSAHVPSTGIIFPPTVSDETWTLWVAPGTVDSWVGVPVGAVSATFTMHAPLAPTTIAASGAWFDALTETASGSGGGKKWGWSHAYVKLPLSDPNFMFARFTVQTGSGTGGSFVAGGDHPQEVAMCDWETPNAFDTVSSGHGENMYLGSGGIAAGIVFDYNPCNWGFPNNGFNTFRFRWYVASRLDDGTGATKVLQNCWGTTVGNSTPGTNPYIDIVVDATKGYVQGSKVSGAVANATNATIVPGSGVQGTITAGASGAGASVDIVVVKDTTGAIVTWAGKQGSNYGFWALNFWVGGTGPTNPKIWLATDGSAHFVGTIESGTSVMAPAIVGGTISGSKITVEAVGSPGTSKIVMDPSSISGPLVITSSTGSTGTLLSSGLSFTYGTYTTLYSASSSNCSDGTNYTIRNPTSFYATDTTSSSTTTITKGGLNVTSGSTVAGISSSAVSVSLGAQVATIDYTKVQVTNGTITVSLTPSYIRYYQDATHYSSMTTSGTYTIGGSYAGQYFNNTWALSDGTNQASATPVQITMQAAGSSNNVVVTKDHLYATEVSSGVTYYTEVRGTGVRLTTSSDSTRYLSLSGACELDCQWTSGGNIKSSMVQPGYIQTVQSYPTNLYSYMTYNSLRIGSDTASKQSTSTWQTWSDERVKQNIQTLDDSSGAIIDRIRIVTFEHNGLASTIKGTKGIGVVAQEAAKVLPNAVSIYKRPKEITDKLKANRKGAFVETDTLEDDGIYTFNFHELFVHGINEIRTLRVRIKALEDVVEELKKRSN